MLNHTLWHENSRIQCLKEAKSEIIENVFKNLSFYSKKYWNKKTISFILLLSWNSSYFKIIVVIFSIFRLD